MKEKRDRIFILPVFLTIILIPPTLAIAATITVTSTNDSGAGSFRQALIDAGNGDTINFNLSGCPCAIVITTASFVTNKELTIIGPGADVLRLDGNHGSFGGPTDPTKVILSTSGTVTIENLT